MYFHEAIRLGAMIRPQCRGSLTGPVTKRIFGIFKGKPENGSCAFGAAIEAAGCETRIEPSGDSVPIRGVRPPKGTPVPTIVVPDEWSPLLGKLVHCPVCGVFQSLARTIPHLNDDHLWTREAISDWVMPIELSLAAQMDLAVRQEQKVL